MTHPTPWLDQPASLMPQDVRFMLLAFRLADARALDDIENGSDRVTWPGPGRWYDVRPMTDPREHCAQIVDMAVEVLAYADEAGITHRHPEHAHIVRIVEDCDDTHTPGTQP